MTRTAAIALLLTASVVLTTACSGEESESPSSTIGTGTTVSIDPGAVGSGALDYPAYSDPNVPIYVALSRRFALKLESEPGEGYSWQVANQPSRDVVIPLGTQLRSNTPGVPGASATQYISFAASGLGSTTIEVRYVLPSGEVAADTEPMRFDVTVTFDGAPPLTEPPTETTVAR
jgi:predicted secreted protein